MIGCQISVQAQMFVLIAMFTQKYSVFVKQELELKLQQVIFI
jgi:hypothetical protein